MNPVRKKNVEMLFEVSFTPSDVGLAYSFEDAILIEKFPSSQIAIASNSSKYLEFSCLGKHRLRLLHAQVR
jgi:hypothetical protein